MALTAERRGVDWLIAAERAQEWRLRTVLYVTLGLLHKLVGLNDLEGALARLQPSFLRQRLLNRLVSAESVIQGRELKYGRSRFFLLLLLVDRPQDMLKLVFRTLWPETEWMAARYSQQPASRWRHLWHVLRHGRI